VGARLQARRRVALAGRVALAESDAPAAGVVVTLVSGPPEFAGRIGRLASFHGPDWERLAARPDRVRTALDGHYWFEDLPAGSYAISAAGPAGGTRYGSAGATADVAVDADGNVTPAFVDIELPVTSLAGRVVDAATLPAGLARADSALVARWRLNEAAGPALDDIGGRHAAPTGEMTRAVPGLVAAESDPGVRLSGGFFQVPYGAALNPPAFTLEAWAVARSGPGTIRSVICSRDNVTTARFRGYGLYASDSNRWELRIGDGTAFQAIVGPPVVLNDVVHLVATFDGSIARLYVNGALSATSGPIAFVANTARPLRIGAGATETTARSFFRGDVDEVAVYNAALDTTTIAARHAAATSPAVSGLTMASVQLEGSAEATFTNDEGRYLLSAVEAGRRTVVVAKTGYEPRTVAVDLVSGARRTLDIGLTAAP
jgi:hypothetical protein